MGPYLINLSIGSGIRCHLTSLRWHSQSWRAPILCNTPSTRISNSSRGAHQFMSRKRDSSSRARLVEKDASSSSSSSASHRQAALRDADQRQAVLRMARFRRQERAEQSAKLELEQSQYRHRYKSATRRWVKTVVALPILLVTSYFLVQRST